MTYQNEPEMIYVVVFSLDNIEYCCDVSNILEFINLMKITHIPQLPDCVEGVINLRGRIINVFNLRKCLDIKPVITDTTRIMIIEFKKEHIGIIVDSILEITLVPVTEIDDIPKDLKARDYIKGIYKNGDRILIFIDLGTVLNSTGFNNSNQNKEKNSIHV
jgi:purine-binding chemotaxis protein CheW